MTCIVASCSRPAAGSSADVHTWQGCARQLGCMEARRMILRLRSEWSSSGNSPHNLEIYRKFVIARFLGNWLALCEDLCVISHDIVRKAFARIRRVFEKVFLTSNSKAVTVKTKHNHAFQENICSTFSASYKSSPAPATPTSTRQTNSSDETNESAYHQDRKSIDSDSN